MSFKCLYPSRSDEADAKQIANWHIQCMCDLQHCPYGEILLPMLDQTYVRAVKPRCVRQRLLGHSSARSCRVDATTHQSQLLIESQPLFRQTDKSPGFGHGLQDVAGGGVASQAVHVSIRLVKRLPTQQNLRGGRVQFANRVGGISDIRQELGQSRGQRHEIGLPLSNKFRKVLAGCATP